MVFSTAPCQEDADASRTGQEDYQLDRFFDSFVFHHEWTIAQWERMATIFLQYFPTNWQADKLHTVDHYNVTDGEGATSPAHGFLGGLLGLLIA